MGRLTPPDGDGALVPCVVPGVGGPLPDLPVVQAVTITVSASRPLNSRLQRQDTFAEIMSSGLPHKARDDVVQSEIDRLLKLLVRARPRVSVRTPANKLSRVPEPVTLHVVVAHLDYALWPKWHEREVLGGAPARMFGFPRRARPGHLLGPVPGMIVE